MRNVPCLIAASLCALLGSVSGHMEIKSPAPRRSTFSKYYRSIDKIDYDMNGPLGAFPCKGYKAGPVEHTYNAGDSVPIEFAPGNTHRGGHCQFALSYDEDKTFVVLKTIVRDCFMKGLKFDVPIPATAPPSKRATLAWTWINAEGNREYYMNCIDITINGGTPGGTVTGPKLLIANLPGHPTIPEMYIGEGDGHELLEKRPIISVGAQGNGNDNGSKPVPTPSVPTTATTVSPSSKTVSTKPTPTKRPTTGLCDGVKAWSPKATYNNSQKSTFNGHLWKAKWWTQDESPKNKGVWVDMGAC